MLRAWLSSVAWASALSALASTGCKSDACLGNDDATAAHLEACETACRQGDQIACDRRSEVERALAIACSRRADATACRALCEGSRPKESACAALRAMPH